MNKTNNIIFILFIFLLFIGCKHDEITRISPNGEFAVNFDFPEGEITAPSKLILVNRSRFSEKFSWRFPEGKTLIKSGLQDIHISDKIVPDTIVYQLPGTYKITLTAWQGGKVDSVTKEVNVVKMKPRIIAPQNMGILIEYEFSANVFQYPGQGVTYSWDFGEPGLTSTNSKPKVTFSEIGLHTITLRVNDGQEELVSSIQVDVKAELLKTLYLTDALTKRIYKFSIFNDINDIVVEPTLMVTQIHPLSISVYNERIYVTETGLGLTYSTGDNALPDGSITSYNINGRNPLLLTKSSDFAGTTAVDYRNDPWMHTFDDSGNIWWTERNGGIRTLSANSVEVKYPAAKFALTQANKGSSTANDFDGGVQFVNYKTYVNEIWVSKTGPTGKGIYRFKSNGGTADSYIAPLTGDIMNYPIRTFVVDTKNEKIYFVVNHGTFGLYKANLDGTNVIPLDNGNSMKAEINNFSQEGTTAALNEFVYVTGLALDVEPKDASGGYIYYGYRSDLDITGNPNAPTIKATNGANSGIKRCNITGTPNPQWILKGKIPYGIAIDNVFR